MPGWKRRDLPLMAWFWGWRRWSAGLQVGCHSKNHDRTTSPSRHLSYQIPVMLPTAGQPFTSVAPDAEAFFYAEQGGQLR